MDKGGAGKGCYAQCDLFCISYFYIGVSFFKKKQICFNLQIRN